MVFGSFAVKTVRRLIRTSTVVDDRFISRLSERGRPRLEAHSYSGSHSEVTENAMYSGDSEQVIRTDFDEPWITTDNLHNVQAATVVLLLLGGSSSMGQRMGQLPP